MEVCSATSELKSSDVCADLAYQGTWVTLVNNCGFTKELAKSIEHNYHILYKESDDYIQGKLAQAAIDGYVTVAFGLRVRTPLMAQVVWGSRNVPYEAKAESRTAGNACGQSYGLLNNRAAFGYQNDYWNSPYKLSILPSCHIHDAQYFVIKADIDVIHYHNSVLPKHMAWQELDEIKHPTVNIGGEVDIHYPDWSHKITLKPDANKEELLEQLRSKK